MRYKLFGWVKVFFLKLANTYQHSAHPFWRHLRENIVPFLYDFLTTGPTLIGFTIPLWREHAGSERFLLACQSLLIFIAYLTLLVFTRVVYLAGDLFTIAPIADSVLATLYLFATGFLLYRLRRGRPPVSGFVRKLWDRYQAGAGSYYISGP